MLWDSGSKDAEAAHAMDQRTSNAIWRAIKPLLMKLLGAKEPKRRRRRWPWSR